MRGSLSALAVPDSAVVIYLECGLRVMRSAFSARLRVEIIELTPCSSGQTEFGAPDLRLASLRVEDYRVNSTLERASFSHSRMTAFLESHSDEEYQGIVTTGGCSSGLSLAMAAAVINSCVSI